MQAYLGSDRTSRLTNAIATGIRAITEGAAFVRGQVAASERAQGALALGAVVAGIATVSTGSPASRASHVRACTSATCRLRPRRPAHAVECGT